VKGYPFEVALPEGEQIVGAILADQVKSLDWRVRHIAFICTLPNAIILQVQTKISLLTE
jgi:mRNA interferase MazF